MEDIKLILAEKEPHEILEYIREQERFHPKTEEQRNAILIAKEIFKQKTGRLVTQHDLIKK